MTNLPELDDWKQGNEEDISIIENCLCPSCGGSNATTTMLPTKIPMFREIIIMSLSCKDCNFRNSEVTFGGEIQPKGCRIELEIKTSEDLNRQLIKSDSCTLSIPGIELEIPPNTQRGSVSTIEGVLSVAARNLEEGQGDRVRAGDLETFRRCGEVIDRLREYCSGDGEFRMVLDDPAGNSFIENPHAPKPDPCMKVESYYRTPSQDMALGLQPSSKAVEEGYIDDTNPEHKNIVNATADTHTVQTDNEMIGREEAIKFPTPCPHCSAPAETDMCVTDIPHFKEVIIMSLFCEACGYKSNEVKGGGAIPAFGTTITLQVNHTEDLAREVLKSDTAGIAIPQLDFELEEGGLDGLYTTVEGLLNKMHQRLTSSNPFGHGDSNTKQHADNDTANVFSPPSSTYLKYQRFLQKIKDMADGNTLPFTLVISDPLSNSFVGPIPKVALDLSLLAEREGSHACYEQYIDPQMTIKEYERSQEQNDTLGLSDMKTENYQQEDDEYYGTDTPQALPDRLERLDKRGPDHPHVVGKAPVESDTTVMGPESQQHAVPAMFQRGRHEEKEKN